MSTNTTLTAEQSSQLDAMVERKRAELDERVVIRLQPEKRVVQWATDGTEAAHIAFIDPADPDAGERIRREYIDQQLTEYRRLMAKAFAS